MANALRPLARRWVRVFFFALLSVVGSALRLGHRSGRCPDGEVREVLVIRLDLLGDVLFSLPVVEALRNRYPGARLTMLTLPSTAALARLSPAVDEVIPVDTNLIRTPRGLFARSTWAGYSRTIRRLRTRHFDLCVSVYGRMGSIWAALSGARCTVGYRGEQYPGFLSHSIDGGRHRERKHDVEYGRALARATGAAQVPPRPALSIPASAVTRAQDMLRDRGIHDGDRLVLIHAGATSGSAKRWPAANWAEFADELAGTGARVALVGASSDARASQAVIQSARVPLLSLVGGTSIDELAALIAHCDLFAGGDSGPLHLAVALGRPVVAIYGPTDPAINGPHAPTGPVRLHRHDLPCSPCYSLAATAECPLGFPICMHLVGVREVVASAKEFLELPGSEDQLLMAQQDALQNAQ